MGTQRNAWVETGTVCFFFVVTEHLFFYRMFSQCNHIAAVLFKVDWVWTIWEVGHIQPLPVECTWNPARLVTWLCTRQRKQRVVWVSAKMPSLWNSFLLCFFCDHYSDEGLLFNSWGTCWNSFCIILNKVVNQIVFFVSVSTVRNINSASKRLFTTQKSQWHHFHTGWLGWGPVWPDAGCCGIQLCWICNGSRLHAGGRLIHLRESHPYYTQCQQQLCATGLQFCDFYIYCGEGLFFIDMEHIFPGMAFKAKNL